MSVSHPWAVTGGVVVLGDGAGLVELGDGFGVGVEVGVEVGVGLDVGVGDGLVGVGLEVGDGLDVGVGAGARRDDGQRPGHDLRRGGDDRRERGLGHGIPPHRAHRPT